MEVVGFVHLLDSQDFYIFRNRTFNCIRIQMKIEMQISIHCKRFITKPYILIQSLQDIA